MILLLLILFLGIQIRVSGLSNLVDPTTGDYTPLALDPYYFLRVSETLLENEGVLPEIDKMRYPSLKSGWTQEILPQSTLFIYKIMKTLGGAKVIGPLLIGLGQAIEIAPLRSSTSDILNLASVAAYSAGVINYSKKN